MSPLERGRSETTTKLPACSPQSYFPTASPQIVELVVRYLTPLARVHARGCFDTFVALTSAGFFSDTVDGPAGAAGGSAEIVDELEGNAEGPLAMGAWHLSVRAVEAGGLIWLRGALAEAGAPVEHCGVVIPDRPTMAAGQTVVPKCAFPVFMRRPVAGYYLRLALNEPADDDQERSFHALVGLWTALVLGLPSRDGHGRSSVTTRPSFERGGFLLGAAGRDLDVLRADAELGLLSALAKFDREVGVIHDVTIQIA